MSYIYWERGLKPEVCEMIIEKQMNQKMMKPVNNEDSSEDWMEKKCNIEINYLNMKNIERLIEKYFHISNDMFQYSISKFSKAQFTKYEKHNYYAEHQDRSLLQRSSHDDYFRKITFSCQLSDSDDYVGGDLILLQGSEEIVMPRNQGAVVCFDSMMWHKVNSITDGTRYSLVSFAYGTEGIR